LIHRSSSIEGGMNSGWLHWRVETRLEIHWEALAGCSLWNLSLNMTLVVKIMI